MESKIKNIVKAQKGITLVALVITIVILIILAVISINAIFGENGLIQRAQEGRKEYEKAEARERLEVVLADAYVEKKVSNEYTEEEFLRDHLDEYIYEQEPEAEVNGEEISLNGYTFALDRSVPELGDYIGEAGNLPPTIRKIEVTNKTLSEIAIEVTAVRAEGVEYRYSYKKQEEGEEAYQQVAEKAENTNTFTGLTSPEKYTIKVELIKNEEIVNKKEITVVLGELEKGTITFEPAVWSQGTASVVVRTTTSYQLQYQINAIEPTGWKTIANGGAISNIQNKSQVYARLWDGTNGSDYADTRVEDIKDPVINEIKEIEVTETTIKIQVDAVDNESGIEKIEYSKDNGASYTTGANATATEYIFTGLTEVTEYTIKVKVTDKAGNETEVSKKIVTDGEKFSDIYTETKQYTDSEGNTAWIPEGFAVGVTDNINKISTGLVITDAINENHNSIGNQFVWIPVGTYKTSEGEKTNNLTRRQWAAKNIVQEPVEVSGDSVIDSYYYGEGKAGIAKNTIEAFKTSATNKGGFYIGRFEQGTGNICKKNIVPYVQITRDQANGQAKAMYNENNYVTSELISSYAWDTALNFICQTNEEGYILATTTDDNYGNFSTFVNTGMYAADKYSNIYDILGNCIEWTSEYTTAKSVYDPAPWAARGGSSNSHSHYASKRNSYNDNHSLARASFRIQLYVK